MREVFRKKLPQTVAMGLFCATVLVAGKLVDLDAFMPINVYVSGVLVGIVIMIIQTALEK